MENVTRLSKNLLTILIVLLIILSLSCSEDPSSPKKEDEDPIPQDAVTIGVEGGIVEKGDLTILIPAGAFTENHGIVITVNEGERVFGESSVSGSYILSGIPPAYSKPLKVKLKYSGELSGENFISVGKKFLIGEASNSTTIYDVFSATDSSGYLITELLSTVENELAKNTKSNKRNDIFDDLIFEALTKDKTTKVRKFEIIHPILLTPKVNELTEYLEEIDDMYKKHFWVSMGLEAKNWKIVISNQNEAVLATYNRQLIYNVSWDHLQQGKYYEIKKDIAQNLIDFEVDIYFQEEISSRPKNNLEPLEENDYLWFMEAIKSWSEELLIENNFYYPTDFLESLMAPFGGLSQTFLFSTMTKEQLLSYGRGFSSWLQYLIQKLPDNGVSFIRNLLLRISVDWEFGETPIEIVNSYNQVLPWHDYIRDYISGKIYDIPIEYFLNKTNHEWVINSDEDTEKIFASSDPSIGKYTDLSSKLFKIKLNHSSLTESQKMLLNMSTLTNDNGGLTLLIFGINNGYAEYIGTAIDQDTEISNLKAYYDTGTKDFLLVLLNNIQSDENMEFRADIDLTIEITPKKTISDFDLTYTKCSAVISINANLQVETEGSTENKTELLIFGSQHTTGSFEGNTYTGSYYNPDNGGGYFSGEIVVTLNETLDTIKTATFTGLDENPGWEIRWEKGFIVKDIPISPYENNVFTTQYDNANVCKSITNVNYYLKQSSITTYIDHTCNEFSNVSFSFSKE